MSKTTKLLLLDSLLQEVCIESGFDESFILINLRMTACLISHNSLYSRLKKAYWIILLTCKTVSHLAKEGYIWICFHSLCHLREVWGFMQPNIIFYIGNCLWNIMRIAPEKYPILLIRQLREQITGPTFWQKFNFFYKTYLIEALIMPTKYHCIGLQI